MSCFPERIEASIVLAPVSSFPHLNISRPCPFFLPFLSLREVRLCAFPGQILPLGSAALLPPFTARVLSQLGLLYSVISCYPGTFSLPERNICGSSYHANKTNAVATKKDIRSASYPLLSKWSACVCVCSVASVVSSSL